MHVVLGYLGICVAPK